MSRHTHYRMVRIPDVEPFLQLGWMPTADLDGTNHGEWSVLCVWVCPTCDPVEPHACKKDA